MEGEARVFDRRWKAMVTASDRRRWRVREKMEGDRALQKVIGFKICLRKTKEKKNEGNPYKKLKTQVLRLHVLNVA